MIFGQLYNLITMDNTPSSYGPIVDIFRFSSIQKLFANCEHKQVSAMTWFDKEDLSHLKQDDDGISREDVKRVLGMLGIYCNPESEQLQDWFDCNDFSNLFEEKQPCLEEIEQAFDVFDENGDGFIDAQELQRVLNTLGYGDVSGIRNCQKMIDNHDTNGEGKLNLEDFVKFMEKCFS